MISSYLNTAQLDVAHDLVSDELAKLEHYLTQAATPEIQWHYQIPELGEGGACSLFGYLQDEPFQLTDHLGKDETTTARLQGLQKIVNYVQQQTGVDWYGIYQAVATDEGRQLLKLVYHGAPSRPLFPLTEAFAQGSNNVQVALSKQARVINNVAEYVAQGGEYYTCDPKVQSEACLPLFNSQAECIGIVDGEAFSSNFFDNQTLALLIACCIKIPHFMV